MTVLQCLCVIETKRSICQIGLKVVVRYGGPSHSIEGKADIEVWRLAVIHAPKRSLKHETRPGPSELLYAAASRQSLLVCNACWPSLVLLFLIPKVEQFFWGGSGGRISHVVDL